MTIIILRHTFIKCLDSWTQVDVKLVLSYIIQRLFLGLITLLVLTAISWGIVELPPSDFVDTYVEELLGWGRDYSLGGGYIVDVMEKVSVNNTV